MSRRGSDQKDKNLADIKTTLNAKSDCIGILNDVKVRLTKNKNAEDDGQR